MRVIKWFVLSVVGVGVISGLVGPAVKVAQHRQRQSQVTDLGVQEPMPVDSINTMASPIDKVDPVTGERGVGFAIESNEDRQVGLVVTNWDGQLQIVLVDNGFRLWMPDDLMASRDKSVMFKSDAMNAPDHVAMTLPKGKVDQMFLVTSAASIRSYTQGKRLYVRVAEPNETYSFDMHGDIVQNQLKAMGVAN
jgi:hypothetical protein